MWINIRAKSHTKPHPTCHTYISSPFISTFSIWFFPYPCNESQRITRFHIDTSSFNIESLLFFGMNLTYEILLYTNFADKQTVFDGFWQQTWLSISVCSVKTAEVFWFSIVNRIFGSACLCNWVCLVCGCHKVSSVFGATVTNAIITWVLKRHLSFDIFRRLGCWDLHQIDYTIKFAYNACIDESPPRFKLPVEFVCGSQAYIWEGTMNPSQRTDSAKIWEMKAEMSPKRDRKIGDESIESQMMARKSVLKWILIDRQLIQATNRQQSNRMAPQITIDKVSQSHTS